MKAYPLVICAAILASDCGAGLFSLVSDNEKLTAVSSSTFNGYVRSHGADGSYAPETFTFGNGGILSPYVMVDASFDSVSFLSVAHMLARPLAAQDYVAARDPKTTNLLVMVYWGTTNGSINVRDGFWKDELNYANANLLGFGAEAPFQGMYDPMSDPSATFWGPTYRQRFLNEIHGDVMSAIAVNRYYVILRAYDFQTAWTKKKLKLLWETRFSLTQRRHRFDEDLPAMAQTASLYFGQDSYGLVMKPVPEGRVDIGPTKVLGEPSGAAGDLSTIAGDWSGKSTAFPGVIVHVDQGGRSTFENARRDWTVPADVSIKGDAVTIKVPGWGYIFRGTLRGDRMTGRLSQYTQSGSMTLKRDSKSAPGERPNTGDGVAK